MMQNCATQTAPEALVMFGALMGFLAHSQGQGLVPLSLESCTDTVSVSEGAFDLLNGRVEDMLLG